MNYIYMMILVIYSKENIDISKASSAGVVVACYNPKVGNTAKTLLFDYLDFTQPEFDTSGVYYRS